MPMLRRAHAHCRDLPTRPKTDVARASKGAGRMTDRLSQIINPRWLLYARPAQATCADSLSARPQTKIHQARRAPRGDRAGKPAYAALCKTQNSPFKPKRIQSSALFPHSVAKTLAASTLGDFPTRAERPPSTTVTPRPASKNLHQSCLSPHRPYAALAARFPDICRLCEI